MSSATGETKAILEESSSSGRDEGL